MSCESLQEQTHVSQRSALAPPSCLQQCLGSRGDRDFAIEEQPLGDSAIERLPMVPTREQGGGQLMIVFSQSSGQPE
jgi:hypothetical protein